MAGLMSRNKGKQGEREVVKLCRAALVGIVDDAENIRRNHQQAEIGGSDLVGVPGFSIEVKRVKRLPQYVESAVFQGWWRQAKRQAVDDESIPCLVYREDHGEWHVAVEFYRGEMEVFVWDVFEPMLKAHVLKTLR